MVRGRVRSIRLSVPSSNICWFHHNLLITIDTLVYVCLRMSNEDH